MQPADMPAGLSSRLPIDLSDDAEMDYMEDSDGNMYDLNGDYPSPYAQHDIGDDLSRATRSGRDALMQSDMTSVKVPRRVAAIEIRQGTSQISRKNNFSI